jgi:iron(III) transport system permease protein
MVSKSRFNNVFSVCIFAAALALVGGPLIAFYVGAITEPPPAPDDLPPGPVSGRGTLGWTLLLALLVAGGAAVLGLPAGIAISRLRGRRRTIAVWFSLFTIVVPPFVFADAWQSMVNSFRWVVAPPAPGQTVPAFGSFTTCVFVLILALWPLVGLATAAAMAARPRSVRESAGIGLGSWAAFRRVAMPFAWPFLAGTVFLVFLMAFVNHTVPTLYLVPVYGHTVFFDYQLSFMKSVVAKGTLPQVALVALGCAVLWFAFRRRGFSIRKPDTAGSGVSLKKNAPLYSVLIVILLISVVLPFGYLFYRSLSRPGVVAESADPIPFEDVKPSAGGISGSLSTVAGELSDSMPSIGWSILFGGIAATFVTILGFLGGYFAEVERRRGWNAVTALALFAFAVPGIVPGLGLKAISGMLGRWSGAPLAFIGCGIPFFIIALIIGRAAFRFGDLRQIEAATISGLSGLRTLRHVILPMVFRPLVAAWFLIFAFALGEVTVIGLFIPPGMETLSRSLFMAMHYGSPAVISIRCLFLAFLTAVPVIIAVIILRFEKARGGNPGFSG